MVAEVTSYEPIKGAEQFPIERLGVVVEVIGTGGIVVLVVDDGNSLRFSDALKKEYSRPIEEFIGEKADDFTIVFVRPDMPYDSSYLDGLFNAAVVTEIALEIVDYMNQEGSEEVNFIPTGLQARINSLRLFGIVTDSLSATGNLRIVALERLASILNTQHLYSVNGYKAIVGFLKQLGTDIPVALYSSDVIKIEIESLRFPKSSDKNLGIAIMSIAGRNAS